MSKSALVTYYFHSGFSVETEKHLLIFDYWRGRNDLPADKQISEELLRRYPHVYVFVSHEHLDHFDPIIAEWRKIPGVELTYVISEDMPPEVRGRRMAAGDTLRFEDGLTVKAFGSTDLGVSFLCEVGGLRIFHAGDLNFWHWQEESTSQEIEQAEREFHECVAPICGESIDLAFFPLDPRQGQMFDAGANYFNLTIKPRIMVPMHFWGRHDIVKSFSNNGNTAETTIVALTRLGEPMRLTEDDKGNIVASLLMPPTPLYPDQPFFGHPAEENDEEDEIFKDTDMPIKLDD